MVGVLKITQKTFSCKTLSSCYYLLSVKLFWHIYDWPSLICPHSFLKFHKLILLRGCYVQETSRRATARGRIFVTTVLNQWWINRLNLDGGYVLLKFYLCVEIYKYRYIADPQKVFINSKICLAVAFLSCEILYSNMCSADRSLHRK